jgi:hypothetical protein
MVPFLLGFQPHESLVMVALEGPRKRFGPVMRLDLADDPSELRSQLGTMLRVLHVNRVDRVLLAAFSDMPLRADPLVRHVLDRLTARGVAVEDAFRVDGQRWWSYVCTNPSCCSPDGTPYDVQSSRVAADAVLAGMAKAADRNSLRALFAQATMERRREVAVHAALLRRVDPTLQPWAAAVELLDKLPQLWESSRPPSASVVAWLALAVQSFVGQEVALGVVDRTSAERAFDLWREVTSLVADDLLPSVGCITAFCAWLGGRGVLASHALDRVFEIAPRHPLGCDIYALLARAVNPRTWDDATGPSSRAAITMLAAGSVR